MVNIAVLGYGTVGSGVSFPMFYGEGLHYALRVRYDFTRRLMFMAKASAPDGPQDRRP